MLLTIFAGLLTITVVIAFHEFFHLLAAKLFGMKVTTYSIGFGPRLFGKKFGDTDYRASPIPLGGYVKISGMIEGIDENPDDPPEKLFRNKPLWQRFLVIAAGPSSNFLLAFLLFAGAFYSAGEPSLTTKIGELTKGYPAAESGLQTGDKILSVNGKKVLKWEELQEFILKSEGNALGFEVERSSSVKTVKVQPRSESGRWVVGISPGEMIFSESGNLPLALKMSWLETVEKTKLNFMGFYQLFTGKMSFKEGAAGPITITKMAGDAAKDSWANLVYFMGYISLAVAVMNFLPIPGLDGFHIFLIGVVLLRGRPLSKDQQIALVAAGNIFVIGLFLYILSIDLLRLVGR